MTIPMPTCDVCHWTNVQSNLNIGEPNGKSFWICHGCVKRMYDNQKLSSPDLSARVETKEPTIEQVVNTLKPYLELIWKLNEFSHEQFKGLFYYYIDSARNVKDYPKEGLEEWLSMLPYNIKSDLENYIKDQSQSLNQSHPTTQEKG